MKAPLKMPLLKKSVKSLLQLLRPEDQVSIVVYSGKAKVVIEATSGTEVHKIAEAIDALDSDGGTDGTAGIRLAYKLANKHYIRGGNNRIVLATDGEFPVGQEILRIVETNAREDIYLTAFHFGPHATPAGSLRQLAGMGKGSCEHISPDNASLTLINEARRRIGK
jgi:secreted protein with Ig-like and vWFA domain